MKPIAVMLLLSVAGLALFWSGLRTHQSLSDDAARAIIDMRTTQCVKDAEARWGDQAEHMVAYNEASALHARCKPVYEGFRCGLKNVSAR